jgi:hypothetical protein
MHLLFLLAIMVFTLFPVKAFIYPDGSVDGLYEDFGPRLDRLQIVMYDGLDAMWTGLKNGEIDVADWPSVVSQVLGQHADAQDEYRYRWQTEHDQEKAQAQNAAPEFVLCDQPRYGHHLPP